VIWPDGFTAWFDPTPVVRDETGAVMARVGDIIQAQVSRDGAAGTQEDPYFLEGIVSAGSFTGCYPRLEDVGLARWWVDPSAVPLDPSARVIPAFIIEVACASRRSPEGRILDPKIEYQDAAIVVTFRVTRRPGGQDCQSNTAFGVQLELQEMLGSRALLDGSEIPPRDAMTVP